MEQQREVVYFEAAKLAFAFPAAALAHCYSREQQLELVVEGSANLLVEVEVAHYRSTNAMVLHSDTKEMLDLDINTLYNYLCT